MHGFNLAHLIGGADPPLRGQPFFRLSFTPLKGRGPEAIVAKIRVAGQPTVGRVV